MGDGLGDIHSILLDLTGKDLVGAVILLTYKGDPILLAVLEAHDVGGDRLRTANCLVVIALLLGVALRLNIEQYAIATAITIYRNALTARLPRCAIYICYKLLANLVGEVYGNRDRVVYPLLDSTLHLHLCHPVDVVGCCLVVG